MSEPKTADVMCRRVVTAALDSPFKELVGLMIVHEVTAIPVVDSAGHPVGVVSEEDLAAKLEFRGGAENPPVLAGAHRRVRWHKSSATVAADLMTTPVATVTEGLSLCAALRLLAGEHASLLCVVNGAGTLVGVLTGRDALRLFLRGDDEIRADLERHLPASTRVHGVTVHVSGGVVTLDGTLSLHSATERAEWIARGVPGVITVRNRLSFDVDDLMITGL
ncbi:CBS domain-containing protein [Lentzea sp. NBC_00516]|uniref:CBS domain-containing protein n=1 Tax=Lentzea sokolovensis TaxID=3095429 RepID=A0ABU4UPV0_9PSEU|nr:MULTISPECIES: CBS domain-containing protein [unclassified Lentzea]MDX8141471.1 CBS domain-containing protein [Lentzea sp. BCCO 10_0061]WUD27294.1 CBS domain-containing protein [Lentzea sp. NBC_00516]